MRCSSMCFVLLAGLCAPFAGFASDAKDYYEITDLQSSTKVQVPFVNNLGTCTEQVLRCDDKSSIFYSLRWEQAGFTLRSIAYDGTVLAEKPLPGFACVRYNDDFGTFACSISQDGGQLLFAGTDGVALYSVVDGGVTPLTPELNKTICWMDWLSDTRVLISVAADNEPLEPYSDGFVIVDIQTRQAEQIYQDASLAWGGETCVLSPDGRCVAFFARKAGHLRVLDLDTREIITVTPRKELSIEQLCWSPDGRRLAYGVETRGRVKVYSVADRKEMLIKKTGEIDGMIAPASIFFLDPDRVGIQPLQYFDPDTGPTDITECGPGGILQAPVLALCVSTAEVEKPFAGDFRGTVRPLAGGRKLLGVVDDDRDFFDGAREPLLPVSKAAMTALGLVGGLIGASSAVLTGAPPIKILDCDSGKKTKLRAPAGSFEMVTGVDGARGCFRTAAFDGKKVRLRTVSFAGKVEDEREYAVDPRVLDVPWVSAWSDSGDTQLFYDLETLKLRDYAANKAEDLLPGMELSISHIGWLSSTVALLVIYADDTEAATWSNTIVEVNLRTKQMTELYRGVSLFHAKYALSPDRRCFAFVDQLSDEVPWDELKLLDLQTKQLTVLVPAQEDAFIDAPSWSPDGAQVAYGYSVRTGYAPGRSPEEDDKRRKEMASGKLDSSQIVEFVEAMNGAVYEVERSINVMSMADRQRATVVVLSEDARVYDIQFLGPDRITYQLRVDGSYRISIDVFSLKSGRVERQWKRGCEGKAWAMPDGKTIVVAAEM